MNEITTENSNALVPAAANNADIRSLVYVIRGQQVMLDNDLAALYQVETRTFNQAVSRNIERFPENFRFQLTKEEYDSLRSQFVISNGRGGRRYLPYAFTEQGIAMLSGVLRSDIAVQVSIRIMNTFVEMRRFISNNALLFERISSIELKQLEYQKSTDERFDRVFQYIDDHAESEQKIFFDGQIYDAFSLLVSIIQKANKEIILIDGYVDVDTLDLLAKKKNGVNVRCYTYANTPLSKQDISKFNAQYATLTVKKTSVFHDRFLILDGKTAYHIGASLKDAGKKCFGISLLTDPDMVKELLNRLKTV
jgi:hypothetical protein